MFVLEILPLEFLYRNLAPPKKKKSRNCTSNVNNHYTATSISSFARNQIFHLAFFFFFFWEIKDRNYI